MTQPHDGEREEKEFDLSEELAKDPELVRAFLSNLPQGLSREQKISRYVRFRSLFHPDGDIGGEGESWVFREIARQVAQGKPVKRPRWRADIDG